MVGWFSTHVNLFPALSIASALPLRPPLIRRRWEDAHLRASCRAPSLWRAAGRMPISTRAGWRPPSPWRDAGKPTSTGCRPVSMAPLGEDAHTPPVLQAPRSHGAAPGRVSPSRALQGPPPPWRAAGRTPAQGPPSPFAAGKGLVSAVRSLDLSHGPAGGFIEGSSRCIFFVHLCSFFFFLHPTSGIFSIFYIPN